MTSYQTRLLSETMIVTENQIETFIRYPESLTDEKKRVIRKQINVDPEAGDYYRWFKSFYCAFEVLSTKEKPEEKTEATITLIPLEKDAGSERSLFVLAAQSSETNGAAIETVRTFASEEHRMILRALHYKNKNEVRIHVLSEQIEKDDVVLFDIPEKNFLLVTSPGGKLSADAANIQRRMSKNGSYAMSIFLSAR
jgi:hypothetical protein